jgi:thiol-disulfide isomerase/thioredoxin
MKPRPSTSILIAALALNGCSKTDGNSTPASASASSASLVLAPPGIRFTKVKSGVVQEGTPGTIAVGRTGSEGSSATASTGKSTSTASAPLVPTPSLGPASGGGRTDLAPLIRDEAERAKSEGRNAIVYVGATWCEPCQRFHQAAQRGELDAQFPNLTVIEFDVDETREQLVAAGYASQFIPLFVVPGPDGRATDRRIEGGVKGPGAVGNIVPRLRKLLDG